MSQNLIKPEELNFILNDSFIFILFMNLFPHTPKMFELYSIEGIHELRMQWNWHWKKFKNMDEKRQ
jgi:hypothetical protein